ncbi:lens fiber membrane intrinsic protein-like [Eublepharis macularius]|uniref:Lens fiber membrane intrinsic protein-like n=1 Tax=Eublepharis macularius TaxID=481883 RepID=A0AA97LHP7_EUBMA|nr:lens fiber membrane intrinsic protein-like [Eublepharis macularius]
MNSLQIATAIFATISFGLLLAAVTSDYWVEASDHSGLWQVCQGSVCYSYGMEVAGYIHATRAFMLMATIAGAVSFFSLWSLFRHPNIGSFSLAKIAAIASLVAGLCALIAMSIFTGRVNHSHRHGKYGWSFGVGWASVPLSLLTGVLAVQIHTGRDM